MKNGRAADGLLPHYTVEQAEEEINRILSRHGDDCCVIFKEDAAKIKNAYRVRSRVDRHRVCRIIARTGLTERSHEHMSAEWRLHNLAWALHFSPQRAADADLDYVRDQSWLVNLAVRIMDVLNIE